MKTNRIIFLTLTMILFFSLPFIIGSEEKENEHITFKLAFLYTNDGSEVKSINYIEPTQVLSEEDQVKIYIKPLKNVYTYLIRIDASGNLELLFPRKLSHFTSYYTLGKEYYIPYGEKWLTLNTKTGEETFYFIASRSRLVKLESLITKYISGMETLPEKKAEIRQDVIECIKKLRLEYSSFTPEKSEIVFIAGEYRGFEESYKFSALDIEADTFYAKTIRITY